MDNDAYYVKLVFCLCAEKELPVIIVERENQFFLHLPIKCQILYCCAVTEAPSTGKTEEDKRKAMSAKAQSLTIYDAIKPAGRLMEIPILLAFNLLLVASAYLSIELPFSPVPITGQTLGVLLVAMALGRVRGTAVVAAYLAEGAAGLPVFASGKAGLAILFGPTGGYLLGFLAAAWLVGYLADCGWHRHITLSLFAMTLGTALIFICGLIQLSLFVPGGTVFSAGLWPFIPGAAVKIAVAAFVLPAVWKFVGRSRQ